MPNNQSNAQKGAKPDFKVENNPLNHIKKTIAVLSGKGGVGKSMITALLATYLQRTGQYRVGVMDADVTGPSIPKLFGADKAKPQASEQGLFPVRTHSEIQMMSINLLLEDPSAPVIWRGPILANTVKQFWTDVIWGNLDFLFLDMPPGTGDIPLTVFQSLPLDGIIIVTSPQDLVSLIVQKAIHMAQMMNVPIIGLVENMSYVVCPHCGKKIEIFGKGKTREVAEASGIRFLGQLPIDPKLASLCDKGEIERIDTMYLQECISVIASLLPDQPDKQADHQDEEKSHSITTDEEQKTNQKENTSMKVAIAAEGDRVSNHFGHCEGFAVFTLEDKTIKEKQVLPNPGHKPGFLPRYLHEQGVDVIIAGGMGSSAIALFQENCIDVITGAQGSVDTIINQYAEGHLVSTGTACREHKHASSCEDHG